MPLRPGRNVSPLDNLRARPRYRFFEALHQGIDNAYIEIRKLSDRQKTKQVWCRTLEKAVEAAEDDEGCNVYFGVCLRSAQKGDEDHVQSLRCVWADIDWKDFKGGQREADEKIASFIFSPSIIVETGNGYHLYWLLKHRVMVTPEIRVQIRGILLGIADALGGDPAVRDLSRILRVPETWNFKEPNNPKPVKITELHPERLYDLADFSRFYVDDRSESGGSVGVPSDDKVLTAMSGGIVEGERNEAAFSYARRLAHRKVPKDEVQAILTGWNRSNQPPLPHQELRDTLESAYRRQDQSGDNDGAGNIDIDNHHHYKMVGLEDLRKLDISVHWLIMGVVPIAGIGLFAGEPGIGKTWLMMSIALAVATGAKWLDQFECEPGRVLMVLEEEDIGAVIERMDLLCTALGLSREEAEKLPVKFMIRVCKKSGESI